MNPRLLIKDIDYFVLYKVDSRNYWGQKKEGIQNPLLTILPYAAPASDTPAAISIHEHDVVSPASTTASSGTNPITFPHFDNLDTEFVTDENQHVPAYSPTPIAVLNQRCTPEITVVPAVELEKISSTTCTSPRKRKREEDIPDESSFNPVYDELPPIKKIKEDNINHFPLLTNAVTALTEQIKYSGQEANTSKDIKSSNTTLKELADKLDIMERRLDAHTRALVRVSDVIGTRMTVEAARHHLSSASHEYSRRRTRR